MSVVAKQLIYTIPFTGALTPKQVQRIQSNLQKLDSVPDYNLSNKSIQFKLNDEKVWPSIIKLLLEQDAPIAYEQSVIPVLGMTCAGCAANVENKIKKEVGMIDALVNFASQEMHAKYIPSIIHPLNMQASVQSIGYDLWIEEPDTDELSLEEIQANKFAELQSKTFWAIGLSLPVVIIGMFFMNIPYANEIMWLFTTPIIWLFGQSFFKNAWKQLKHKSANMDTLVALSTGIAYIFSVFNMVFPAVWLQRGLHAHVYFEAAAVIIAFILLGKWLEAKAKRQTGSALHNLMALQPQTVTRLLHNGQTEIISLKFVEVGDTLLAKPGEKIAVDGKVVQGTSYVDESMLSGEPMAIKKSINDKVYAGTINQKGSFQYKALKVGNDTLLAQIIKMVQKAQGSKAPVQKLVDRIASIFVPVVLLCALITFIIWISFGGDNGMVQGLLSAITVLVIACPCALGLATPTAIMVGIGKAAEKSILIKDAESLELAQTIDTIVLDKTGTITQGVPHVVQWIEVVPKSNAADLLYSLEHLSEHPLAEAIVQYFKDSTKLDITNFESITGKGIKGQFNNNWYYVGTKSLLLEHSIPIADALLATIRTWEEEGQTVVWLANEINILAILGIADQLKPTSKQAIETLQAHGIQVHMLTGDNYQTATRIAQQTGILHIKAEVLPQDKATYIQTLQAQGHVVAMVGDGINDSTALAQANVSIAMSKGSAIAIDVATMTIMSSDLNKIPDALKLSKQTVQTIRQNLFWAFIYNVIGIPLAAGILYPINGFLLNPMLAGAAMALSSVSVVTNSLRLKWRA